MVFKFRHSLASRAAVSAVISLYYHEDIDSLWRIRKFVPSDEHSYAIPFHRSTESFRYSMYFDCRSARQGKVMESVSSLCVPESLKRYLLEFVQIIGDNLKDFISSHYCAPESMIERFGQQFLEEMFFDMTRFDLDRESTSTRGRIASRVNATIDVDLRKVLRWTPDGEIDLEQTGEALVRNESDPIKRFRLACEYCREGEMLQLWPSVQDHFSSPEAWDSSPAFAMSALFWWRYFHHFWPEPISTYVFQLNQKQILTYELLFSCFSCYYDHCSPLTVYLLNKKCQPHLTITRLGRHYMNDKRLGEILFRMPESSFDEVLRRFPFSVFELLLCWRHQSYFVDAVERNWDIFKRPHLFESVMRLLINFIARYPESDVYKSIFRWFWAESVNSPAEVARFLYPCRVDSQGRTLEYYVDFLFEYSLDAEFEMRRVLLDDKGRVRELLSGVDARVRDVLEDLVRTCMPAEEMEERLNLLQKLFHENTTK